MLIGLLGGTALAAGAASRRTATAYDRFLEDSRASHLSVQNGGAVDLGQLARVAAFPEVESSAADVAFNTVVGEDDLAHEVVGSLDGRYLEQDRMAVLRGRLPNPDRLDEVIVNEHAARTGGVRVGDRLSLRMFTEEQVSDESLDPATAVPAASLSAHVVGVGLFSDEVTQDDSDRLPRIVLTPAFTRANLEVGTYAWQGLRLRRDADVGRTKAAYADLITRERSAENFGLGGDDSAGVEFAGFTREAAEVAARVDRSVRPHAVALAMFAGVAALATLVLGGTAIGRHLRAGAQDMSVLRALGAPARTSLLAGATVSVVLATSGTVVAVAVAVALSPFAPIGPVRRVEPDPGVFVDALMHGVGAVALAVLLTALGVWTAWRTSPQRAQTDSRRADAARVGSAAARLPLPARVGVGMALAGTDRSAARATWSTIIGVAAAVAAIVSALCFGASLRHLVASPPLYGWNFDVAVVDSAGYGRIDIDKANAVLETDREVAGWSGVGFGPVSVGAGDEPPRAVPFLIVRPLEGDVRPEVLSGRNVQGRGEVVVGERTLDTLGVKLGDTLRVSSGESLRIVGTAVFPSIGVARGARTSLGEGGLLTIRADGEAPPWLETQTNALFVRLRAGADRVAAVKRLGESLFEAGEFPGSIAVVDVQRPAEIAHHRDMGSSPSVLAALLGVGAVAALTLSLAAFVRRGRRDLAVLKVIGFTRRQVGRVVQAQGLALVLVGGAIGVPVGVAAGRWLWRIYAEGLYVEPQSRVPVLALVATAAGAVVLTLLAAAGPSAASRRTPASVLRTE